MLKIKIQHICVTLRIALLF